VHKQRFGYHGTKAELFLDHVDDLHEVDRLRGGNQAAALMDRKGFPEAIDHDLPRLADLRGRLVESMPCVPN